MKPVTIIIPTINNLEYLVPTVKSIAYNTVGIFRFLIINQGNKAVEDYINITDPGAGQNGWPDYKSRIVHFENPLGWAGAINKGLALMAECTEYVLFLNDDIMILPGNFGWLTELCNVMEQDATVGAVGPASNFVSGWQNFSNIETFLYLKVKYLIGFCMLVRRSVIDKIGGLDQSLPGGDDFDFSIRVRDAGYNLIAKRNTYVHHWGQVTGKKTYGDYWDSSEHQEKTNAALIKKHGFKKFWECIQNTPESYEGFALEYGENNIFQERGLIKGDGLDIGCGRNKEPGAIGVDVNRNSDADIIAEGDKLLTIKDNSQDFIVSRHSIEHFHNPFKLLAEWRRVLKKDGVLCITTPDGGRYPSIEVDGDHKHQYTRDTMMDILKFAGFKLIEMDRCGNELDFYCIAKVDENCTRGCDEE